MLILDALFPGTPSQLVANCKAVGAAGCLGYVWRPGGIGGWSAAHFNALRSAGLITAPIVVPAGDSSSTYSELLMAAKSFGFSGGPLVFDMEGPYNLPSPAWWNGAIQASHAAGFKAIKYGNAGDVQAYANGDGWWKASYIQTTTKPAPALPAGLVGWQYADMDAINGIQYDASVFADIFQEVDMTPEQAQQLADLHKAFSSNAAAGQAPTLLDLLERIYNVTGAALPADKSDLYNAVKEIEAAQTTTQLKAAFTAAAAALP